MVLSAQWSRWMSEISRPRARMLTSSSKINCFWLHFVSLCIPCSFTYFPVRSLSRKLVVSTFWDRFVGSVTTSRKSKSARILSSSRKTVLSFPKKFGDWYSNSKMTGTSRSKRQVLFLFSFVHLEIWFSNMIRRRGKERARSSTGWCRSMEWQIVGRKVRLEIRVRGSTRVDSNCIKNLSAEQTQVSLRTF